MVIDNYGRFWYNYSTIRSSYRRGSLVYFSDLNAKEWVNYVMFRNDALLELENDY